MEYHLTFEERHTFKLTAKDSPNQSFQVSDMAIDLSKTDLFSSGERSPQPLIPFAAEARAAFAAIDGAPEHSPLVNGLRKFREERLPPLLAEIENPPNPAQIASEIFNNPENAKKVTRALKETIAQINRELPQFFTVEKTIGTFRWLRQGGEDKKLGISLAPEKAFSPDAVSNDAQLLVERSGQQIKFNAKDKTAYVLTGNAPSAATVFESLCNGGALGTEMHELNQGAILREISTPLAERSEMLETLKTFRANQINTPVRSKLMTILRNTAPGALAVAALGIPVVANALNNALTVGDLIRVVGITVTSYLVAKTIPLALRNRERKIESQREHAAMKAEGLTPEDHAGASLLNIFSTALLEHTLQHSASSPHLTVAPKAADQWMALLPKLAAFDPSTEPMKKVDFMGMEIIMPNLSPENQHRMTIDRRDDYSGHELEEHECASLAIPIAQRIHHIERASETWNMFHAVALMREFSERQKIPAKSAPWLDLKSTLTGAGNALTDETLTYPEVSQSFSKLTSYFKLNRESWNLISRALFAAHTLERVHDSRRAQEIARGVFKRHFG